MVMLACVVAFASAAKTVPVTIDVSQPAEIVNPRHLNGTCLPIWNSKELYNDIAPGLQRAQFHVLRFPNGSMSNDYHWNGSGSYSEDRIWQCDTASYEPGFVVHGAYRGTSKFHYGFEGCSHITDGDTSTMWWSDPSLTRSDPWFYCEFDKSVTVDSLVLYWGEHYGVDFDIDVWGSPGKPWPRPHAAWSDQWRRVKTVRANDSRHSVLRFDTTTASNFLRVKILATPGSGTGVQVCELYAYAGGEQVTRNAATYRKSDKDQTRVIALSGHPGDTARADFTGGWVDWDFEAFMSYVNGFPYETVPVICVNYATGTPEEAARWVYYANIKKGYDIRFWQVGNEMDGEWEECGPVSATMYAENFLRYAQAMKAVDPTIKVFGPVLAGADFDQQASFDYNDGSWMATFLRIVGEQENKENTTYLDGVDFHCYPYWFGDKPFIWNMLQKSDYIYDKADVLVDLIQEHMLEPDSVNVFLSEYNSSVVMSSAIQKPVNAVCLANMYGSMAEKFGRNAMALVWDSYEGLSTGPDGTSGSLSLFSPCPDNLRSTLDKAPTAAFWANYLTGTCWLDTSLTQKIVPCSFDRAGGVRAFAVTSKDESRALLINLYLDTLEVACTLDNGSYAKAEVMTWGEREFAWIGENKRAYAAPNCGPSSRRGDTGALNPVILPPYSMAVVRWYNESLQNGAGSAMVHAGAYPLRVRTGDTLRVWGTVHAPGQTIAGMAFGVDRLDSLSTFHPLDNACDGPFESYVLELMPRELGYGVHTVYVKTTTSSGATIVDSTAVRVSGTLRPALWIDNFEDGDLLTSLPENPPWRSHAPGDNATTIDPSVKQHGDGGSYLEATFTVEQPADLSYDNYVMLYVDLDTAWMASVEPPPRGISLRYAAHHSGKTGKLVLQANSTPVKDHDHFNMALENTGGEWKTLSVAWEDLTQYGWGAPIETSLQRGTINRLEFRAVAEGSGYLAIDDLVFLSDTGKTLEAKTGESHQRKQRQGLRIQNRAPGSGVVLSWPPHKHHAASVAIFDSSGRLVHTAGPLDPRVGRYTWHRTPGGHTAAAAGSYTVLLRQGDREMRGRFVVVE